MHLFIGCCVWTRSSYIKIVITGLDLLRAVAIAGSRNLGLATDSTAAAEVVVVVLKLDEFVVTHTRITRNSAFSYLRFGFYSSIAAT